MKHNKNCPLYKREITIGTFLREELRKYMPYANGVGEIRVFSEARVKGRRVKFWCIPSSRVNCVADSLLRMHTELHSGLRAAGYQLKSEITSKEGYRGGTNVEITITRLGS